MPVKRLIALAVLFATTCGTVPAWGQEDDPGGIRIRGGYVAGVEYLDMDGLQKKAYVKGLIEGMLLAPAFGASEEKMLWLYDCTDEMDVGEIRKLLFDYIKDRYDLWENRNPAKNFRAISQACLALLEANTGGDEEASGDGDGSGVGAGEVNADRDGDGEGGETE